MTPNADDGLSGVRVTRASHGNTPRYTIGTLVTDAAQYDAMHASFIEGGFSDADCEYLFIDNTRDVQTDAYRGLNAILNAARAPVAILCHQDVRLLADERQTLDERLDDLTSRDPSWAAAGNAGGVAPGRLAVRISDPHGGNQSAGALPARVQSLDENFLIVRRDARIGFSRDLSGFHFYGADICLHAAQMGCTSYVIDFHIEHLSPGKRSVDFDVAELEFRAKWSRALQPRWIQTTCSLVYLSGAPWRSILGRFTDGPIARIARRLPGAQGWTHRPQTTS
ncbi:MAG: hypothetical protein ACKVP4_04265 [Hyphomicrobium sp.]